MVFEKEQTANNLLQQRLTLLLYFLVVVFAQTPPHLVFGRCGLIGGGCFFASVDLNYTAAGLRCCAARYTKWLKMDNNCGFVYIVFQ